MINKVSQYVDLIVKSDDLINTNLNQFKGNVGILKKDLYELYNMIM